MVGRGRGAGLSGLRGASRVLGLCLLLLAAAGLAAREPGGWTATDPPINFRHIELGEINRHGEAVGFHHRPHGVDPAGARVLRIVQGPDAHGVYRARVAIRNGANGAWIDKRAPSTFFPDDMSDDEVVAVIVAVFRSAHRRRDGRFVGDSGRGFAVEGWYQNGRINAAYPLRGP
jgi:transglutaminase-like putative cysteine protease